MTQELDFTIEFNSELENESLEDDLFTEADDRLRKLARGHDDLIGSAVNLRKPAHGHTTRLFEATVVVYVRPENIAATEKADNPETALKGALDAVERQVRKKREKLGRQWERPKAHPEIQELAELAAAEKYTEEGLPVEEPEGEPDEEQEEE
jgi:ribosome-associated translation inhibitor RaiA